MFVTTVTGPIDPAAMGVTSPHEHVLIDIRNQFTEFADPEKAKVGRQRVGPCNLPVLARNPYAVKDNLCMEDMRLAEEEINRFKALGGRTIIDCTSKGIGRDGKRLRELALRTGLNIVAGCGYYTFDTHPAEMDEWSPERLAEEMLTDLADGMDGTDVRAGVIGEIGTSHPVHPNEKKVLMAAAAISRRTNAPVYVHTYPWARDGVEIADLLLDAGVAPGKVVICHTDVDPNLDYMRALLDRGVFLEFDNFGKEFDIPPEDRGFSGGVFVTDTGRVETLKRLLDLGFEAQILIATDVCLKSLLRAYGGKGYDHVLRNVVPMMRRQGIAQGTIRLLLMDNPQTLFS